MELFLSLITNWSVLFLLFLLRCIFNLLKESITDLSYSNIEEYLKYYLSKLNIIVQDGFEEKLLKIIVTTLIPLD